ncbi:SDR family NAD(P)-dependent oxidoreductase [Candidatus Saccharibacteria bacterium]|nr:SDR family NAD(P)-dependent oxidoreductase [Candidatus Saccharibacteria bacterium]
MKLWPEFRRNQISQVGGLRKECSKRKHRKAFSFAKESRSEAIIKFALTGSTKALQQEAAEYGVRVTGLYPGTVKTKLFAKAGLEIKGNAIATTMW